MAYPWPPFPALLTFLGGHGGALPEELQLLLRAVSTYFRRRGLSLSRFSTLRCRRGLVARGAGLLLWARLSRSALCSYAVLRILRLSQKEPKPDLPVG